ncbi:TBC1 domain family member 7 [Trichonephila inaurata madagascariensis]|uniref:TBC1 domain family member 7 n=1 Tax=Trichonephila inaurata madagascariensis TaxID=2747483 RepID=A0A8X7BVM2_9ARAC|nr:TBC1 domain family member 7 [Trichonephila inaurata madagascariensis]
MSDKRNFRSSYYDKVGFRGVEEKRSLEILINEKPIDKEKLSKFCLRFTLPAIYREYVWKVLLGVLPVNLENHGSVLDHWSNYYIELEDTLKMMRKIRKEASRPVIHTLMFLMVEDLLEFDTEKQLESSKAQSITALATFFLELCSTEVVAFWMLRNFILHQRKFSLHSKYLKENLEIILKQEDDTLYEHIKVLKAVAALPLDTWFERYFAEVLHESSLARILDKVIGGSCKILACVAAALLIVRRHLLLPLNDSTKIVEILCKNPEDISDVVVNKALDLYG